MILLVLATIGAAVVLGVAGAALGVGLHYALRRLRIRSRVRQVERGEI